MKKLLVAIITLYIVSLPCAAKVHHIDIKKFKYVPQQ